MSALLSDFGPRPRDELASLSTARISAGPRPEPPPYPEPSPPGTAWHVAGRSVYVRRTAGPSAGTDTWFLHGLDGSSRNWDRLAACLADLSTGYAPDLPGSGRSEPPPRLRDFSLVREAALVAALVESSGRGPVHLVGNSRGGVLATFLAARRPELVRTLTLVSPAVPDLRLVGERGADARLALVMLPGVTRLAAKRLGGLTPASRARGIAMTCFGEPEALTDADLDAAAADFSARAALPWADVATVRSLQSLIRSYLRPTRWSWAAAARSIRVPTLVVWGTRDRLVDVRLAERCTANFVDGRLLVLPRTGHVAQMERPQEVARAMVALWQDAALTSTATAATNPGQSNNGVLDRVGAPEQAASRGMAP